MKRAERHVAKQAGLTRYFTGKPCKYGHVAERFVSTKACVICAAENTKRWAADNMLKKLATKALWQHRNPEKLIAYRKAYRARNPVKCFLDSKHRKHVVAQRTPAWADTNAIHQVYLDAREFRDAGLNVCVDHVIPLQGELVSGLHVPQNLRVCLSSVNQAKSNTYQIL